MSGLREGCTNMDTKYMDARPGNYDSPDDVNENFDSLPPKDRGVGYGTIFHAAKEAGYSGPPAQRSVKDSFAPYLASVAAQEQFTPGGKKKQETGHKRIFTTRADDKDLPQPSWLVKGLLPANADTMIYGPSGACKSFLAIDIAASIAAAMTQADMLALGKYSIVKPGAVFYCAAEGGRFGVRAFLNFPRPVLRNQFPHPLQIPALNEDLILAETHQQATVRAKLHPPE